MNSYTKQQRHMLAKAKLCFALDDAIASIPKECGADGVMQMKLRSLRSYLADVFDPILEPLGLICNAETFSCEAEMLCVMGMDYAKTYSQKNAEKLVRRGLRIVGVEDRVINEPLLQWLCSESYRYRIGIAVGDTDTDAIGWLSRPCYDPDLHNLCLRLAEHLQETNDPLYLDQLDQQCIRNEAGENAVSAREALRSRHSEEDRLVYEAGMLPNKQIIQRAKRGAVREFLKQMYHKKGTVSNGVYESPRNSGNQLV